MIYQKEITLHQFSRGFHLITHIIEKELEDLPEKGLIHVFIKHTSAALMINENADPTVRTDMETIFKQLVPENNRSFAHTSEGSDDMPAHAKSAITGNSISIPISNHRMNLGTWQGIYLCEFRNHGGSRRLVITVVS